MRKILSDLNMMVWIAIVAGVGGTGLTLFLQFHSGIYSAAIFAWLTLLFIGAFSYQIKKAFANLDDRLARLEQGK